ncbi:MAG: addiction module antidote protein, HigA family [Nitrospira sp. LK265]|nr:addiction module antidote protein, HigA family [Nitrospira sp. LK265]
MARKGIQIGMKPSHPGAFIKTEILDELGLSVTKAAEILRVRRATFSDLVHEKAALSPEMALRLEKAFHLNMELLLQMQAWYDSTEMRKQAGKIKIEPFVPA